MITLNNIEIPGIMSAVVLEKPYHLVQRPIPIWPIKDYNDPDLMLIKVEACGICGSDFRYYKGQNPWAQHTLGRYIDNPPNIVLGHEYSGIVVGVLNKSNKKWLGKRVIPICSKTCGTCDLCKREKENLCENTIHIGHGQGWGKQDFYPGAYADYTLAWGKGCFEIPKSISFEEATTMDVLAVGMHAINQGNIKRESSILIIGGGPVGNGIAQIVRIVNPTVKIFILENSEIAININNQYDFDYVINSDISNEKEIRDFIFEKTNKLGINTIFDTIGTETSFNLGLSILKKTGTYVNLAIHDLLIKFNQMKLSAERKITSSSNFLLSEYKQALKLLGENKIEVKPWFTEIKLSEVPKIFHQIVDEKQKDYFKIIIKND
ncbi:MAG: zinc-dependent alcohol dehydrogenase [Candidatus Helarchaeota archaeon]